MARARFGDYAWAQDPTNANALRLVPTPQVTVYEPGTTTPIGQTLYAAPTGGTTRTNPFTAAADGFVEFYLDVQQFIKLKVDGTASGLGIALPDNLPTHVVTAAVTADDIVYDASVINVVGPTTCQPLVEGTSNASAGDNTTRLEALWLAVSAVGGGKIWLKPNTPDKYWWFTNNIDLTTGANEGMPQLVGSGPETTRVMLAGTTGPFFKIQCAPDADGDVAGGTYFPRPGILFEGFSIHHDSLVTSGADILQGYRCSVLRLNDLEWKIPTFTQTEVIAGTGVYNYSGGTGAIICVETKGILWIDHCLISSRVGTESGTPRTIVISNNKGQTELVIRGRSHLSTAPVTTTMSPGASPPSTAFVTGRTGGGVNIDCAFGSVGGGTGRSDLISLTDRTLVSGGNPSIRNYSNGVVFQLQIDGCQLDVANVHIDSRPMPGADAIPGLRTLQVRNCWVHADYQFCIMVNGGAPGPGYSPVQTRAVLENLETNGGMAYFANLQDVSYMRVANCQIGYLPEIPDASYAAIYMKGAGVAEVVDNQINVLSQSVKAAVEIAHGNTIANVHGNTIQLSGGGVRGIIAPGGRTSGKNVWDNVITDPNLLVIERNRYHFAAELLAIYPTARLLWMPSPNDQASSRTLESQSGQTVTFGADVAAAGRQFHIANDLCLLDFDGLSAHNAVIADSAGLSFPGTGGAGACSMFALAAMVNSGTIRTFLAKQDGASFEYWFGIDNVNRLFVVLYTNAGTTISATSNSAVVTPERLHWYGMTWDGSTAAGLALYQDGGPLSVSAVGSFSGMSDTSAALGIGVQTNGGSGANFMNGQLGLLLMAPGVASATERWRTKQLVDSYYELGL